MSDADDLADALHRYDEVVGEYVDVNQRIHDGLPPARRKPRWWLTLGIVMAVVLAIPLGIVVGRGHFRPPSTVAPLVGWPDATNTGVPAGTSLTTWTGGCTLNVANTVISNKLIDCTTPDNALLIRANNIQITNSKVLGLIDLDTDLSGASGWSLTFSNSEVDSGFQQRAAICCGNLTISRSNIHGGQTAVQCESGAVGGAGDTSINCDISDSYLHGQAIPVGAQWHLGGFLSEGGNNTLNLTHNYVICDAPQYPPDGGCSGDINLIPNFEVMRNVNITNNKLGASINLAYCTFGGEKSTSAFPHGHDIKYHDNVFERGTNGKCGDFGPWTDFGTDFTGVNSGNEWINNRFDDGVLITAP